MFVFVYFLNNLEVKGAWSNIINNDLIVEAISSYLVWARDFFWNYKNTFDIALIPDGHHIYTGTLKAAWYRLLKPAKTLILIWEWAVDKKMQVYNCAIDNYMWKKFKLDKKVLSCLSEVDFVEFVDHKFDWIDSELPFARIISNYDNIQFLELWDKISKLKLNNLLLDLSKLWNLMFVSDFHRDKSMEECKDLDSNILDLEFIKKDKDLHVIESFLNIAKKIKKDPLLLSYLNTGDISTDKTVTNWFGCVLI